MRAFSHLRSAAGLCAAAIVAVHTPTAATSAEAIRPVVKVVAGGESIVPPEACRTTLVGPGLNQPEAYPGYGGFVGWNSPVRLKDGDWLIGFSAGYWHASPPTPLHYSPKTIEQYRKMGMPDIIALTGGRAMTIRSGDGGKTWGKPTLLLDSPDDDRHPGWAQLPDGTLLCSLFLYPGGELADFAAHPELAHHTVIVRSHDGGRSWDKDPIHPPTPFVADESDGPIALLADGSPLLTISGSIQGEVPARAAVFTSHDSGATWELLSVVKTDHSLDEANAVQLHDGRLVLVGRPEGDLAWSSDGGRTWTPPVTFGFRIMAPSLYVLADGTLVCLHGSYAGPRRIAPDLQQRWRTDLDRAGPGVWLSGRQLLRLRQGDAAARRLAVCHRPGDRRPHWRRQQTDGAAGPACENPRRQIGDRSLAGTGQVSSACPFSVRIFR